MGKCASSCIAWRWHHHGRLPWTHVGPWTTTRIGSLAVFVLAGIASSHGERESIGCVYPREKAWALCCCSRLTVPRSASCHVQRTGKQPWERKQGRGALEPSPAARCPDVLLPARPSDWRHLLCFSRTVACSPQPCESTRRPGYGTY